MKKVIETALILDCRRFVVHGIELSKHNFVPVNSFFILRLRAWLDRGPWSMLSFQVAQAIVDVAHELFVWHPHEFLSERFDYVIEG